MIVMFTMFNINNNCVVSMFIKQCEQAKIETVIDIEKSNFNMIVVRGFCCLGLCVGLICSFVLFFILFFSFAK